METDRADKDRPRIQVVDYALIKSPTLPHIDLQDGSPIVISGIWILKKININIYIYIYILIYISILMFWPVHVNH